MDQVSHLPSHTLIKRSARLVFVLVAINALVGCEGGPQPVTGSWVQDLLNTIRGRASDELVGTVGGNRCPAEVEQRNAAYIDSLCMENIPRSAKIWFEREDTGEPCWCLCTALTGQGPIEFDTLIAARTQRDKQRIRRALRTMKFPTMGPEMMAKKKLLSAILDTTTARRTDSLKVVRRVKAEQAMKPKLRRRGSTNTPRQHSHPASQVRGAREEPTCSRAEWYLPFGAECVSVLDIVEAFEEEFPVFKVEWADGDFWPWSDGIDVRDEMRDGGTVPEDSMLLIVVPEEFVDAEEVGGELFAMILAHEIGHGLADPDPCTPTYLQVCEGTADYWGAARILRRVYSDDDYIRVSKAAEAQMEEYYYALGFSMGDCARRWCECTSNESCAHPPLECRLRTIRMARWADSRRAVCSRDWAESEEGCRPCPAAD